MASGGSVSGVARALEPGAMYQWKGKDICGPASAGLCMRCSCKTERVRRQATAFWVARQISLPSTDTLRRVSAPSPHRETTSPARHHQRRPVVAVGCSVTEIMKHGIVFELPDISSFSSRLNPWPAEIGRHAAILPSSAASLRPEVHVHRTGPGQQASAGSWRYFPARPLPNESCVKSFERGPCRQRALRAFKTARRIIGEAGNLLMPTPFQSSQPAVLSPAQARAAGARRSR